jgi:hypothetical protein
MTAAARESVRVKSTYKSIDTDSPEFDDFFRRGDQPAHGPNTLQLVVEMAHDEEVDRQALRTPAQVARRAKFIKLVSVTMACLTVSAVSAFTYKALQGHKPTTSRAMNSVMQQSSGSAIAAQALQQVALPSAPVADPIQVVAQAVPVRPPVPLVSEPEQKSEGVSAQTAHGIEPMTPEPVVAKESTRTASMAVVAAKSAPAPAKSAAKLAAARSLVATKPSVAAVPIPAKPAVAAKPAIKVTSSAISSASPVSGWARSAPPKVAVAKKAGSKPADYRPPTASFSD